MNILIIEDNMADQFLIMEAFKNTSEDCVLHCVDDGAAALDWINDGTDNVDDCLPDVVLSDLNLPTMSGHEVLGEMKQNSDLMKIPVIILSGTTVNDEIERSYELGACAHVEKPSSMERYYEFAKSVLDAWTPSGFLFGPALGISPSTVGAAQ